MKRFVVSSRQQIIQVIAQDRNAALFHFAVRRMSPRTVHFDKFDSRMPAVAG